MVKNHDSSPWQIIYQKAQFLLVISKNSILIGNIKSPVLTSNIRKLSSHQQYQKIQFLLATLKGQFSLAISKRLVLTGNIKKPNSHWQHQNPNSCQQYKKKPDSYWYYLVKNPILLILGKYHMIKLPMPITAIVLKA